MAEGFIPCGWGAGKWWASPDYTARFARFKPYPELTFDLGAPPSTATIPAIEERVLCLFRNPMIPYAFWWRATTPDELPDWSYLLIVMLPPIGAYETEPFDFT